MNLAALTIIHKFRVHIMEMKPFMRRNLSVRTFFPIIRKRVNGQAAPGQEFPPYLDIFRIQQANQVFHYNIHAVFMKIPMIAETEQI